jgi:hypothetical protein
MTAFKLSEDGMTLVIQRPAPGGVHTTTLHRQPQAGPFTVEDIALALSSAPAGEPMQVGQRNRTSRAVTRFGTLWTHVMAGPPTWWLPKARREQDGTVMAGWLRLAVAVKFERRPDHKPGKEG